MTNRFSEFIAELRRRHVLRAVAVYAAVAFVVLQAGEIILPAFEAPVWVLQLLVVLAALGFPVVLLVAWVYALTPRGLERTDVLDAEAGMEANPSVLPQVALAVATLVALGSAGLWFVRQPAVDAAVAGGPATAQFASDVTAPITALAVLPLQDFSGDSENDYFAASMHEEIIAQLSRASSLRIVSRTSVAQYAETTKSTPEIAAELGVQGIVTGSVTRSDGRVRITMQLIHAPADAHMWSNSYDREMQDVLTLQAEVAAEVVRAIQGEVEASDPFPQHVASSPVDPDAHEAFMRGQFAQQEGSPESLLEAEDFFMEALRLDSTFAPAAAGLAGTRFLIGLGDDEETAERLAEARADAQRALELDEQSDEARAVLIAVGEHLADLGERIDINVDMESLDGLDREYLKSYTDFGQTVQEVVRRRPTSEPSRGSSTAWRITSTQRLMADGEYGTAAEILEHVVQEQPGLMPAWAGLERAYALEGDFESAVETRRRRVEQFSSNPAEAATDVESLAAIIEGGEPNGYWKWVQDDHKARRDRGDYASDVEFAAACVALGNHSDALTALEVALENRDRALLSLRSDPVWDPLRQDPRFKAIQAQVRRPRGERRSTPPATPTPTREPRAPGNGSGR